MTSQSDFEAAVEAIITGDVPALQALLAQFPALATTHSTADHQATLLHYVTANGVEDDKQITPPNIVDIARLLLDAGADLNANSASYGGDLTPLVALVSSAHPARAGKMADLVRLFCEYGANPDGIAGDGVPLAIAIAFRYPAAIQALVEAGADINRLPFAAAVGDLDAVNTLLSTDLSPYNNGFGTITVDPAQIKAIALAAGSMAGHLDIVRALVELSADPNAHVTPPGGTALHEAAVMNHAEIVEFLLHAGANSAAQDHQGFTPLHWAAWEGHLVTMDVLLAHDAPLEMSNKYGGTVLTTAVYSFTHSRYPKPNQIDTLQKLVAAGADVRKITAYPTGQDELDRFLQPLMDGAR